MLNKFCRHAAITFGFLSNIRIIPFGLRRLAIPRGEVNFADELGGQRKLVLPFLDAKRQKTGSRPLSFRSNWTVFSLTGQESGGGRMQSVVYPGPENFHFSKGLSGHVLLTDRSYVHRSAYFRKRKGFALLINIIIIFNTIRL